MEQQSQMLVLVFGMLLKLHWKERWEERNSEEKGKDVTQIYKREGGGAKSAFV